MMRSTLHLLGAFLIAAPAIGETIEYRFTGAVIDVFEGSDSFGGLQVGNPFVASFVFDTTSPDLLPADPANGRYNAISAFFQVPNRTSNQLGGALDVSDGAAFDTLDFDTIGSSFEIRAFFTGDPTALSNDSMPDPFPPMNGTHVLNVFAKPGPDKFAGTITSATIVPEPEALSLLAFGALAIRRRQSLIAPDIEWDITDKQSVMSRVIP